MSGRLRYTREQNGAGGFGSPCFIRAAMLSGAFLLFLSGGLVPVGGEVIIQRSLPESGTNQSEAQWKRPGLAEPAADEEEPEEVQRLSGRLIIGGNGSGGTSGGMTVEDWSTDSELTYGRLFGDSGLLEIKAEAFRKDRIDRFDQQYRGAVNYGGPELRLALSGDFEQQEAETADGRTEQYSGTVSSEFATSEESVFPLELQHSSAWEDYSGSGSGSEEIDPRREERHQVDLTAKTELWAAAMELDGYAEMSHDRVDELSTLGYGGTLGVSLPFTELLSLYGAVSPGYSSTEDQVADEKTEEIALEYDAGLQLSMEERLAGEIHAALVDTRRRDPDVDGGDQVRDLHWKGRTSWRLTAPQQLTSSAAYLVSGEDESAQVHDLSADSALTREEGLLRSAKLRGRLLINEDTEFSARSRREEWELSAAAVPAERMEITGSYSGSRQQEEETTWDHEAAGRFSHAPAEELDYGFNSSYGYSDEDSGAVHRFAGGGDLNLSPQIGFRRWDIGLAERYELERSPDGTDHLSRSDFSTAVPVARQLSLRYALSWEWVDFAAADAEEGSAFTHTAGMDVTGAELPFSFRAAYLLGHGYRGLQHQGDARLELTVAESLNLVSEMTYRYAETVDYETPFRFSVLLHYEF